MDQVNKLPRFGEFSPGELEILFTSISSLLNECYLNRKFDTYKEALQIQDEIVEAILFVGDE